MTGKSFGSEGILGKFLLTGATALVTGAGQGIGRAFAKALGEAGARVAIADINMKTAGATAEELRATGIECESFEVDVTSESSVKAMVQSVVAKWGGLTIGFNNAGIGAWLDGESQTLDQWNRIISINLTGVFLCCRAEAEVMLKTGYGKIVNTASMSAHIVNTPQHQSAYNTSKAGVLHLTRSLAAEWAGRGIRVNSISPGYTRTQLLEDLAKTPEGSSMVGTWKGLTPLGRFAEVEDLQGAAVYLASRASDYMTGHDLVIDGGYTLL
jgi:NAD(P)-dependent dehydrogenase (short-subunit alcohol dehydrogenase family)